jgi:DNA-binding NarL/FixJ family response regulator
MSTAQVLPAVEGSTSADDLSAPPPRRVVLIDPREDRRAITNLIVGQCPPLTVVGLAGSLGEAQTQIRAEHAHAALVEIQMPVTEGLATIDALRDQFPDLRIVVCSFHGDQATRDAALTNGADGYLTKPFELDALVHVIVGPEPLLSPAHQA